jgi:hypothetical protein
MLLVRRTDITYEYSNMAESRINKGRVINAKVYMQTTDYGVYKESSFLEADFLLGTVKIVALATRKIC